MAASRNDIEVWFDRGKKDGATHMIVVCDTYDHMDYPVMVTSDQDAREERDKRHGKNMQSVMEVYDLNMDKADQMKERRAFNY